jgi:hypothetical protein
MSLEIQQRLPLNFGFFESKASTKSSTRFKDEPEYSVISMEQWNSILSLETNDEAYAAIETFRIKPATIKVSIDPEVYKELGYISNKLDLRMSEQSLIKEAVESYVKDNLWMMDGDIEHSKVVGVGHSTTGRSVYVKIKLLGSVAASIGYPNKEDSPGSGLCKALGVSRQLLVQHAVTELIKKLKG